MTEWKALNARILALIDAGSFFLKKSESDHFGVAHKLTANADETYDLIRRFSATYSGQLSDGPKNCLDKFVFEYEKIFAKPNRTTVSHVIVVAGTLTYLASFRAEFEYLITDAEERTRSLVVRAFIHLQRSIVADDSVKSRWMAAYRKGETECESLGACHLLLHGVWSFKTSAKGERTDLVMGEPLSSIDDDMRRAAHGLVLTEWKKVNNRSELDKKRAEAKGQAMRYQAGILAGFELQSPRYVILVSEDHMDMIPSREVEGDVAYEFRNVAVNPATPSRAKHP